VRLVSFNLLHGMGIDDGKVDEARLRSAVRMLDADVLALQEVDRAQPRSHDLDLVDVVADEIGAPAAQARFVPSLIGTPGFAWQPASADGDDKTSAAYGVGLVSRLPVAEWHTIELGASPMRLPVLIEGPRRTVFLARDEPRVAVAAVLSPPAPVGTVVATHLSFAPGWNAAQLRRLARAVQDLPAPVVLLGDLNLPGRVADGLLPGWQSMARLATYPADRPRTQLDHALLRTRGLQQIPKVRAADAVRTPISDHRALVIDLA
jgi:endonuclease/exonuclease/phosphatase family metal-dependent hydrolase